MTITQIATASGLYVPLVFWHFIADWLTQTEKNAEAKHHDMSVLIPHCLVYTILFIPLFWLYGLQPWEGILAGMALFGSHVMGDLGVPVWWWAKYIRKMTYTNAAGVRCRVALPSDMFRAGEPVTTPRLFRPVLVIVIDQLWHLAWLWVIVGLALHGRA